MIESGPTLDAMIAFARALESESIDLRAVEVHLPEADWRKLSAAVARDTDAAKLAGDPAVELVTAAPGGPVTVDGIRYLIRYDR
jgi:hypothetical protein